MGIVRKKEVKGQKKAFVLTDGCFAGCYAAFFAYDVQGGMDFEKRQAGIMAAHQKFLDELEVGPERRILERESRRKVLKACTPFPDYLDQWRTDACRQLAVCPWCYASNVNQIFKRILPIIRQQQFDGMWLSVTQTIQSSERPPGPEGETLDAERKRIIDALAAAFRMSSDTRARDNRRESRLARNPTLAAIRFADIAYKGIEDSDGRGASFVKSDRKRHFAEVGGRTEKQVILVSHKEYEVINRALVLTPKPLSPNSVLTSKKDQPFANQINNKLTGRSVARLLGMTMQQSLTNNSQGWRDRNAMIFIKQNFSHKHYLPYGEFHGKNDEINTTAAL